MNFPIHPERLGACLAGGGAPDVVTALMASERFRPRLLDLSMRHYRVSGAVIDDPTDRRLAALDLDGLEALVVPCGAVAWASVILREIRGSVVQAMVERFGPKPMALARMLSELALDRAMPEGVEALEDALRIDGRGCIGAWIAAQPMGAQTLLRLKWPSDHSVPDTQELDVLARGAEIVRRVALAEFQA